MNMKTNKEIKAFYKSQKVNRAMLVEVLNRLEDCKENLSLKQAEINKETLSILRAMNKDNVSDRLSLFNHIEYINSALEKHIQHSNRRSLFNLFLILVTMLVLGFNISFLILNFK